MIVTLGSQRAAAWAIALVGCISACSTKSATPASKTSSHATSTQGAAGSSSRTTSRDAATSGAATGSSSKDAGRDGAASATTDGGNLADAAHRSDGGGSSDAAGPTLTCAPVTLGFMGTVETVANTPLGLTSAVRTTKVSGSWAYLPCVPDQDPDPQRGIYEHPGGAAFSLSVGGLTVGGSGTPRVEVENFDPDTIRWRDGAIPLDKRVRIMTVDGKPAPTVEVTIAITDDKGSALSNDALPTAFPYVDITNYPHTFSVQDSGGTLLIQLSSLQQM